MSETKFTTSFIPKKPTTTVTAGGRIRRKRGSNLFATLTTFLFLGVIVFGVGVYLYKISVEQQIERQIESLNRARSEFNPEFIDRATRLNDRIKGVVNLLNSHVSPSQLFTLLEDYTLQTVKFDSLDYTTSEDGDIILSAAGVGRGFPSIVLQSDEFGRTGFMKDVLFSGLEPDENDLVRFTVDSVLDRELIIYRNSLRPVVETEAMEEDNLEEDNFTL